MGFFTPATLKCIGAEPQIGNLDLIRMVDLSRQFNKVRDKQENEQMQGRDFNRVWTL